VVHVEGLVEIVGLDQQVVGAGAALVAKLAIFRVAVVERVEAVQAGGARLPDRAASAARECIFLNRGSECAGDGQIEPVQRIVVGQPQGETRRARTALADLRSSGGGRSGPARAASAMPSDASHSGGEIACSSRRAAGTGRCVIGAFGSWIR
jgi:hypothetical protein